MRLILGVSGNVAVASHACSEYGHIWEMDRLLGQMYPPNVSLCSFDFRHTLGYWGLVDQNE